MRHSKSSIGWNFSPSLTFSTYWHLSSQHRRLRFSDKVRLKTTAQCMRLLTILHHFHIFDSFVLERLSSHSGNVAYSGKCFITKKKFLSSAELSQSWTIAVNFFRHGAQVSGQKEKSFKAFFETFKRNSLRFAVSVSLKQIHTQSYSPSQRNVKRGQTHFFVGNFNFIRCFFSPGCASNFIFFLLLLQTRFFLFLS